MAQQYKEKIAAGGELTAQQIANMNHIVSQQLHQRRPEYLCSRVVVYSTIFYGIKTWLNVRNNKHAYRSRAIPYVSVPEGGVKTSAPTSLTLMPDSATRIRPTKSALTYFGYGASRHPALFVIWNL
ncbi:hypothetical protein MJ588_04060 [Klebsiella pneumoniae]|nr:hypothetical protein MJ588_04060 [Klebsiella pneumoniae]